MILVLMILCLSGNLFAQQDYSNNRQYLINPYSAFCYYRNIVDLEETITLKTNIMNFSNKQGNYHINFDFKRDLIDFHKTIELYIKVCSPKLITPYDGLDQNIEIVVTDGKEVYQWREIASFNKREAFLEILDDGAMSLVIRKKISYEDFSIIHTLFSDRDQVTFFLVGLEGSIGFAYPREVVSFYKLFFDYKETIYKQ